MIVLKFRGASEAIRSKEGGGARKRARTDFLVSIRQVCLYIWEGHLVYTPHQHPHLVMYIFNTLDLSARAAALERLRAVCVAVGHSDG